MKGALAAVVLSLASTHALAAPAKPAPPPPPAQFDDAAALGPFTTALAAQRAGTVDHPLRVAYFGDSLTADDQITGELRRRLQEALGDGGPGFVFALAPHPMCEHRAVRRSASGGWRVNGLSTTIPGDHLLGLGGSAETDDDGTVTLTPTGPVRAVDVHYLAQPHGGALDLVADGTVVDTIATADEHKRAAFERAAVPAGTKHISLRAHGRVRLFGAALEAASGAVVDNLGVVSGTVKQIATFDLPAHLQNQLAHRAADLVVIMYGTNEAEWLRAKGAGMEEHEKLFGELLATVRAANPAGACLVVSPLDQLDWREEKMPARTSIPAMVEAQRRAAHAAGCAFWDTYAWMGGAGASRDWYRKGWIVADFQHPTTAGAERIAGALYAGLVGGATGGGAGAVSAKSSP